MSTRTRLAFLLSFLLFIAVVLINAYTLRKMQAFTQQVDRTQDVITQLERVSNYLKSAEIFSPAYARKAQKDYYALFRMEAGRIPRHLDTIRILMRGELAQKDRLNFIIEAIGRQLPVLMEKNIAEIILDGEQWRLDQLFSIHQQIRNLIESQDGLLVRQRLSLQRNTQITNGLTITFSAMAIGIFIYTFVATLRNTRKRKWLEGFLKSVLDTSGNGVIYFKAEWEGETLSDFVITFINRTGRQLFDTDKAVHEGQRLTHLLSLFQCAAYFERFREVMIESQQGLFELPLVHKSHTQWLLVSLARLENGVTASLQDITSLKRYEQELQQNIVELERSNRDLEQYAYAASHDLQEPLRKIRSFGSYLQDTQMSRLDEKGRLQLQRIIHSAERMSGLIHDLLMFSSARKDQGFETTNLNGLLQEVLADFELALAQQGAIVEAGPLPVIDAIPHQLNQLFSNLVSNALKFAREGERPRLTISARSLPGAELEKLGLPITVPFVELRFSDNGIGFPPEYGNQIFGLFKRLNSREHYPGSGIGLALCKKVVENHNGHIRAESLEGQGSTFFIYLPKMQKGA
jgi:signal transduction histidine kinase